MTAVTVARESTSQCLTGEHENDEKCSETLQHIWLRLKLNFSAVKLISLRSVIPQLRAARHRRHAPVVCIVIKPDKEDAAAQASMTLRLYLQLLCFNSYLLPTIG